MPADTPVLPRHLSAEVNEALTYSRVVNIIGPGKRRNITAIVFYLGDQKLTFGSERYALPVSCLWGDADRDTDN